MSFHRPDNQQVCWSIFWQNVVSDACLREMGYTAADCERFHGVAMRRFDAGEPIWMVALELKSLIDDLGTADCAYKPEPTPLQMTTRVVRI